MCRGDIIIAFAPDNPSMQICKRITALEGDRVTYKSPNTEISDIDDE